MKKYGVWAKRSATSAKAESLMKDIGTANVSCYPKEMRQELDDAPASGMSMKL